MLRKFYAPGLALMAAAVMAMQPAFAETPDQILASIQKEAADTPGFQGFSAARGESFFRQKHGNEWSCSSCHTDNPAAQGKHDKTGKSIKPLAPSANAERFTSQRKVDKWFKRNCNDVLGRVCTAQEKGDVLTYLLTVKN
jgi:mono/diheme cytochrome c family protein